MGIAIHNLSSSGEADAAATDLAAAVRQTASGLLGTTVQLADLVRRTISFIITHCRSHDGLPFLQTCMVAFIRLYPS